jgi:hypothetical protein
MANDFLEQLAEFDVPPPPAEFGRQLHVRMNRTLVIVQLIEFACGAVPRALWELGRALGGWARFTLTGKYELNKRKKHIQ